MTIEQAREILKHRIGDDGTLSDDYEYLSFGPGEAKACLDGDFTADQLEAIAVYMRAMNVANVAPGI